MERKRWTVEGLSAFLEEEEWMDVTGAPEIEENLGQKIEQLVGAPMCHQLTPMLNESRAHVWEAGTESGLMNLIKKLENPCLGVVISNDDPDRWCSARSIFNPEDKIAEADQNGAILLVLQDAKTAGHFTGKRDVGLRGDKFNTQSPTYRPKTRTPNKTRARPKSTSAGASTRSHRRDTMLIESDDSLLDFEGDEELGGEEEILPEADTEYVKCKGWKDGKKHAPDTIGIRFVLITCAPVRKEEAIKAAMADTEWFAIRTFHNKPDIVGRGLVLEVVNFEDQETIKVVRVSGFDLVSLLWSEKVPMVTKIMTAAASTFGWVGKYIEANCEVISYERAQEIWGVANKDSPTFNDYVISVACVLLGTCYTQKKNIGKQMLSRINALKAYCGKAKIELPAVTAFTQLPNYEPGANPGIVSELIGKIVCLVGTTKTDCNAKAADLLSIPAINAIYHMDTFTEGLLVQFRLVAQKVHSTTLRFAIASIPEYLRVSKDPESIMSSQAETLLSVKKLVENRPYTGCCHPLPTIYQIAQYPHMCFYGVKVYAKSLTDEEKILFVDYNTSSIESKLNTREQSHIQVLVDHTPALKIAALAEWIARLDLASGMEEYNNKNAENKEALERVWKQMEPKPEIYQHLLDLENAKARTKTNEALRKFLTSSTQNLIANLWEFNKQNLHRYRDEVSEAVRQIESSVEACIRENFRDQSEIDASLNAGELWHEKEYIEKMMAVIGKIVDQAHSISDTIKASSEDV